jgi:UDP-glucose 4-epimerase
MRPPPADLHPRPSDGKVARTLEFSGKSVLVTGGAGFIGSHVADALVGLGARVTVVDNLSTGFRQLVPERARFVEADLTEERALDAVMPGQDFVFHFAANADVREGLLHPRRDVVQNILATQNVLEAMRAHGVKQVAFSSTGSTYGESEVIPTPEDAPFPIQTSLYGASKVAAEGLLSAYAWGYGFTVYIFRFVSMLGPRYSHGHVIDFYKKLKRDPTRLDVLGDGHQKKSYLHVLDCVRAMRLTIERSKSPTNIHVTNIGHQDWLEVNESIRILCDELKLKPELCYTGGVRGWVGDSPKILLDTKRLRGLGWEPQRTIEESIRETIRAFEEQPFLLRGG